MNKSDSDVFDWIMSRELEGGEIIKLINGTNKALEKSTFRFSTEASTNEHNMIAFTLSDGANYNLEASIVISQTQLSLYLTSQKTIRSCLLFIECIKYGISEIDPEVTISKYSRLSIRSED